MSGLFPEDSAARKEYPVYSGFIRYFPAAIAAVAHHSFKGNLKHNPGQPLHHDRAKSDDELDAMCRHLMEHEIPGMEDELIAAAWRAMSELQKFKESRGAPIAPGARIPVYEEQAVQHHAIEAPMPPLVELHEGDDCPEEVLKGGEAYREHGA